MNIRSFIAAFRKKLGPKLPEAVEKMFSHQEQPDQDHPVFGHLSPHGIGGWKTQFSTEFTFDGETKRWSVDCFVQEPNSTESQANFVALSSSLEGIAKQFVSFQLADLTELESEPNEWDDLFLDLEVADALYSTGVRWAAEGHGGPDGNQCYMFFEGLELKGIVPLWDDPVSKGFEDW
jgi:hypothetical protein